MTRGRCQATCLNGQACSHRAQQGRSYCGKHIPREDRVEEETEDTEESVGESRLATMAAVETAGRLAMARTRAEERIESEMMRERANAERIAYEALEVIGIPRSERLDGVVSQESLGTIVRNMMTRGVRERLGQEVVRTVLERDGMRISPYTREDILAIARMRAREAARARAAANLEAARAARARTGGMVMDVDEARVPIMRTRLALPLKSYEKSVKVECEECEECDDTCPICLEEIKGEKVVCSNGHAVCEKHIIQSITANEGLNDSVLKCSVCRSQILTSQVSYACNALLDIVCNKSRGWTISDWNIMKHSVKNSEKSKA